MKTNPNAGSKPAQTGSRPSANRPEIRDDLDSRKNEEQDIKGDDLTNNSKETKSAKQKKK